MTEDPFAGRIVEHGITLRRAADQASLGRILHRPGEPLPYLPIPFRKPTHVPDPCPCATLEQALAALDAFAPPLPPASLPTVIVAGQPSTEIVAYADGRLLDGLFRGDIHGHCRPFGSGKNGRIIALLHRRRTFSNGFVQSADGVGGVKRLPKGGFWVWYDGGGRRIRGLEDALNWLHQRHLAHSGISAHARLTFETNLQPFLQVVDP